MRVDSPSSDVPTAARWRIACLLLVITTLTFIDRINMSVAAKYVQQEFHLSSVQIGSVLSAFVLGYALFQVPGGVLGDRFGPRRMLVWAVLWWSVFTALTAVAPSALQRWLGAAQALWLVRFLVGCGEAPALPNANKVIGRWMASNERGRGNSVFILGVGFGGAFTPPAIAFTMAHYGWRVSFIACGIMGFIVAGLWYWYSTEWPGQHRSVNAAELAVIGGLKENPRTPTRTPWKSILASGTVWALLISNTMQGYVSYVFYTWFYLYVVNVRGLSVMTGSYWSTAPFVLVMVMAPLGGYMSDAMVKRMGYPWGRRIPVFAGSLLSGLFLVIGARLGNPYLAICALALGGGWNIFVGVSFWVLPNDLSRHFSGSVAGLLNMAGNLGGALSPTLTPLVAGLYGWTAAFDFAAIMMAVMGTLWFLVHPENGIDPASENTLADNIVDNVSTRRR